MYSNPRIENPWARIQIETLKRNCPKVYGFLKKEFRTTPQGLSKTIECFKDYTNEGQYLVKFYTLRHCYWLFCERESFTAAVTNPHGKGRDLWEGDYNQRSWDRFMRRFFEMETDVIEIQTTKRPSKKK